MTGSEAMRKTASIASTVGNGALEMTMVKIEAGKCYRTREGEKVGPMRRWRDVWYVSDDDNRLWRDDGTRHNGPDLISEWHASDFDPNWPHGHITRDGRKARIVCTDRPGAYPIVAILGEDASTGIGGEICRNMADGRWDADHEMGYDLLNAPAPKREFWVNVYSGGRSVGHHDRTSADEAAATVIDGDRIACVHVIEGDGL